MSNKSVNELGCLSPECEECNKSCSKANYQYADISLPISIKPSAAVGAISAQCSGEPTIVSKKTCCNSCDIVITQRIRIKIPIQYDVSSVVGKSVINCNCSE